MPAPFNSLTRIKYFPETDTMYLTGYTTDRPHIGKEWGTVGTEIVRYFFSITILTVLTRSLDNLPNFDKT